MFAKLQQKCWKLLNKSNLHQLSQLYQFYFNSINYIELILCLGILFFPLKNLACFVIFWCSSYLAHNYHNGVFYYHKWKTKILEKLLEKRKTSPLLKPQKKTFKKMIQTFYFSQTSSIRSTVPPLTGSHIPPFYCMLSLDPFLMWILMILQHIHTHKERKNV